MGNIRVNQQTKKVTVALLLISLALITISQPANATPGMMMGAASAARYQQAQASCSDINGTEALILILFFPWIVAGCAN